MRETSARKRFWVPRDGYVNLSDRGFLVDPDSELSAFRKQDAVPFESIAAIPCLCLLGEPGMGKSTALEAEYNKVRSVCPASDKAVFIQLRAYSSDQGLRDALFKSSDWMEWLSGTHGLDLFLDSLDECRISVANVAAVLLEGLKQAPPERLQLRIACRTADWRNTLEAGLLRKYGETCTKVYELAPLRSVDVVAEAEAFGAEPSAFLNEVISREAVPLAIRPITLKFLLNTYKRAKAFPRTRAALYEEGCRCLCEETSPHRRDAGQIGTLTANQRMAIASRIAAVTILGNHDAIWRGLNLGDVLSDDIVYDRLVGGTEVAGDGVAVTMETLAEVLDITALFSSRGMNRLGWSHQSYAEFLAARCLDKANISVGQMLALVMHPGDPGKVVPQLHETAAWLAGMVPEVFREIAKSDPEVLLRSDVAMSATADRRVLVQQLLVSYDEGKLVDFNRPLKSTYGKLGYPEIASDLRPYIVDGGKGVIVRRVAIDIAEANHLLSLQNELISVALDASDSHQVRFQAAFAVGQIGDPTAKARLKALALGLGSEDPDDELKGCGLRATWPAHMSAAELFPVLTFPKKPNLSGLYGQFLRNQVVAQLQPTDLPIALEWSKSHVNVMSAPGPMCDLLEALFLRALDHLDSPSVLERLAEAVRERLRNGGSIDPTCGSGSLRGELMQSADRRRRLLMALLPLYSSEDTDLCWSYHAGLFMSGDLRWLVQQLDDSAPEGSQKKMARLIARLLNPNVDDFETVLLAARRNKYLGFELKWLLTPVDLGSPEAAAMKEQHAQHQAHARREVPILDPPPSVRIRDRLNEFESGNPDAFWRLILDLSLTPNSTHYTSGIDGDLTALPGWHAANEITRRRIIAAATKYLADHDPETREWFGSDSMRRPAVAGYQALHLLLKVDSARLDAMPTAVWEKCAPIVLAFPLNQRSGEDREVLKLTYQRAPAAVIEALRLLVRAENANHGTGYLLSRIEGIWDPPLEDALLDMTSEYAGPQNSDQAIS